MLPGIPRCVRRVPTSNTAAVVNLHPDYFAVLRQARRPWLDPDQLKTQYQELTFAHHPDRQKADADQTDFSAVTEAYRVLNNPRLRLLHLLTLETNQDVSALTTSSVPDELAAMFMEAATLVQQIDGHRQKQEQSASALGKSLLKAEEVSLKHRAHEMLDRLNQRYDAALQDLRNLDEQWMRDAASVTNQLMSLGDRFGYLDRWINQLREKQFQLSS